MYKASAGIALPTSIIGSLPRPSWYTPQLGPQSFLEAMMDLRYREQYEDAVSVYLRAQETAGLDICTDGDAHFDEQISGMSWQSYPLTHMGGFFGDGGAELLAGRDDCAARAHPPRLCRSARPAQDHRPVGPGNLQYAAMWKAAQRLTNEPVKFGTILPQLLAASVAERVWAISDALNSELHELADAGCPVIQMEEPQIHMVPVRGQPFGKLDVDDLVELFNNTVKGLRDKTVVWCHTCWGNPSQQQIFREVQSYQPTLAALNQVDSDAVTFETCSSGTGDLEVIGERSETRRS